MRLLGSELEYGVSSPAGLDPEELSGLVVDAWTGPATPPVAETHNRMLANGARLYVDHAHPEYSTPECTDPRDVALHEAAGDAVVLAAARHVVDEAGIEERLFRNNTDGKGASYGYHENHLLRRETPFEAVVAALPAFLVPRVVLFGAGRVGLGQAGERPGFQLSQRADFVERVTGLETTRRRALVNTRDEPLARRDRWRRLHLIVGDANRNPWTTWLRHGATALVLAALEAGRLRTWSLADPVAALRAVSRDVSLRLPLRLADRSSATAIELQRRFVADCAGVPDAPAWAGGVLAAWAEVLDDLERDPATTTDRLDWTAKLGLLEHYRARDGLGWDAPRLAQLDLAWAEVGGGVHEVWQRRQPPRWTPTGEEVARAVTEPPPGTRAHARGRLIADHPDAVVGAGWESMLLRDAAGGLRSWPLDDPFAQAAGEYAAPPWLTGDPRR